MVMIAIIAIILGIMIIVRKNSSNSNNITKDDDNNDNDNTTRSNHSNINTDTAFSTFSRSWDKCQESARRRQAATTCSAKQTAGAIARAKETKVVLS